MREKSRRISRCSKRSSSAGACRPTMPASLRGVRSGESNQLKDRHRDERSIALAGRCRRDVRYAVRTLGADPGLHRRRHPDAGARHRRQHGHLQRRQQRCCSSRCHTRTPIGWCKLVVTVPAAQSPTGQPLEGTGTMSVPERFELQPRTKALSHVAFCIPALMTLSGQEEAARLQGALVEPAVLTMLGVQPVLRALFRRGRRDPRPGCRCDSGRRDMAAPLPRRSRHCGSDVEARRQGLRGRRHPARGICLSGFDTTQFWIPVAMRPVTGPAARGRAPMLARLADGVLDRNGGRRGRRHPSPVEGGELAVRPVRAQDTMVEPVRRLLLVLMGTVGVVLLIACVNVASLSLARTACARTGDRHPGRAWRRTRPRVPASPDRKCPAGAAGGAAGHRARRRRTASAASARDDARSMGSGTAGSLSEAR